jgi:hypothetical protein
MFNMDFGQAMIGNVIVHLHGELLMVHGEGPLPVPVGKDPTSFTYETTGEPLL